MEKNTTIKNYELQEIAIGLTFVGGFIDAYTFIQRGGVMAAGQTGNVIFIMSDLVDGRFSSAFIKIMTMVAFMLGIAVTNVMNYKLQPTKFHWRVIPLVLEIVVCLIVGLIPTVASNLLVTPPLAFVMAMQISAFTHIDGHTYNSTFTTGNIRNMVNGFTRGIIANSVDDMHKGTTYSKVVVSFVVGALVSALIQKVVTVRSIWIAAGILTVILAYYWLVVKKR
ncbi:hypothetical protein FC70_GL001268 [Paucilactobacillus oligofermentans DSM 15707 = LMG 22743]|uniref:Uncharacterized protein n=1 Tax=Paucilactobacillus oligofermentans DSM 15707 = LMG 22743 TaxID=1423778 RepID=A0A0R1RGK3_9LACO|nr:YoaK family protein [Paucilactobacillus oligofermentans]KRL55665.1 hypothetical protein FC70_GL001268 [Paucilactobacillus oligofermentans DSM 15707 = LMG 22743]CUS25346.1 Putative DUF1275-containing membrane protein [Paucilactobacillus oligofermentans DSM 15707 = LMG 22743]